MATTIVVLVVIGLVLGILIYVVNIVIPHRVKGLEKTEEMEPPALHGHFLRRSPGYERSKLPADPGGPGVVAPP